MVSMWWVAAAFLVGGCAGTMVFALMAMASRQAELALGADEKLAREGPAPVSLEPTWTAE